VRTVQRERTGHERPRRRSLRGNRQEAGAVPADRQDERSGRQRRGQRVDDRREGDDEHQCDRRDCGRGVEGYGWKCADPGEGV